MTHSSEKLKKYARLRAYFINIYYIIIILFSNLLYIYIFDVNIILLV